ncbi:MAG: hypothetical protein SFX72_00575 [Isosphaeraceae bacterium]|nr:hypothetical protein [Isosphaeraceae bacterium]
MSEWSYEELEQKVMQMFGFRAAASPASPAGGGGPGQGRVPGPSAGVAGSYVQVPMQEYGIYVYPFLDPLSPANRSSIFSAPWELSNNPAICSLTDTDGDGTPDLLQAATATGPLQVPEGQVTFDAEGNDTDGSPYFSRRVHWPGGLSGVTIGRGYDMGSRSEADVKADLVAAGMSDPDATAYSKGAGKTASTNPTAKKWVDDNKATLNVMTQAVQKQLFINIYPVYKERAEANYDKWTKDDAGNPLPGKVEFDDLDQAIRDIVVDFVYQGFTKGANPMVKSMKNDYDELIEYIEGSETLKQYEAGRKRADYLRAAKKAKSGG